MSKATPISLAARTQVKSRETGRCARCGTGTQQGHWHHRRSRSVRDDHVHCACNGVWLCGTCHTSVHASPFEARRSGFIVSRHATPKDQPFLRWDGAWILPDCKGGAFLAEGSFSNETFVIEDLDIQ